jgi:hypothetical protein
MSLNDYIGEIASGTGGLVLGSALGYAAGRRTTREKNRRRKASKSRVIRSRTRRYKQKKPRTAGKRKDTSTRRIRYTKNNQPYVIMANGRARFIKKSGVRNARKRKGGRY